MESINNKANTLKARIDKLETDCNCGFWKLVRLSAFQSSFFVVNNDWYDAWKADLLDKKL